MKIKLFISLIFLIICFSACSHDNKNINENDPFDISASAKIIKENQKIFQNDELIETDKIDNRLNISVHIDNITDKDLKKVWFELRLNDEVKPFIASQIIYFKSDKMDLTSKENAFKSSNKNKSNKPLIWAFEHDWGMLLTPEEDLKEYHNLASEQIVDSLKYIEVNVHWKGGDQTQKIPLKIEKSD